MGFEISLTITRERTLNKFNVNKYTNLMKTGKIFPVIMLHLLRIPAGA